MPVSEDRAFTVNILGTLAQTIVDRQSIGMEAVAGFGGNAPAALITLRFYPERPISFLAHKLRISHPGAVQLVDRLAAAGLVERVTAIDGRSRHAASSPSTVRRSPPRSSPNVGGSSSRRCRPSTSGPAKPCRRPWRPCSRR